MKLYEAWASTPLASGLWRHQVLGVFHTEGDATHACEELGRVVMGLRTNISHAWLDRLEWNSGFVSFAADGREIPDLPADSVTAVRVEFILLDESNVKRVYVLSHASAEDGCWKGLGIFRGPDAVLTAVRTAAVLPGFRSSPAGFIATELDVGRVYWPESPVVFVDDEPPDD